MRCPFCGDDIKASAIRHDHENLVHHVIGRHPETGLRHGNFSTGGACVVCWCGKKLAPSVAYAHFFGRDMARHFLEHLLLGPVQNP